MYLHHDMEYRGKCLEMPHSDQTIYVLFTVSAYSLDGHSMLNIKRMVNVNVEMRHSKSNPSGELNKFKFS